MTEEQKRAIQQARETFAKLGKPVDRLTDEEVVEEARSLIAEVSYMWEGVRTLLSDAFAGLQKYIRDNRDLWVALADYAQKSDALQ